MPPVLFVHGNGAHAALWVTTLWRMESNGVARDRMLAINFTNPPARSGAVDHREVAFHPRAFREIYKFIAGRPMVALFNQERGPGRHPKTGLRLPN